MNAPLCLRRILSRAVNFSPIVGGCALIGQKKWEKPVDFCVKAVEFVAKTVDFFDKPPSAVSGDVDSTTNADRSSSKRTRSGWEKRKCSMKSAAISMRHGLRCVEQRQEGTVAFALHLRFGNEAERGTVDAIAQTTTFAWAIVEYMT